MPKHEFNLATYTDGIMKLPDIKRICDRKYQIQATPLLCEIFIRVLTLIGTPLMVKSFEMIVVRIIQELDLYVTMMWLVCILCFEFKYSVFWKSNVAPRNIEFEMIFSLWNIEICTKQNFELIQILIQELNTDVFRIWMLELRCRYDKEFNGHFAFKMIRAFCFKRCYWPKASEIS